MLRSPAATLGLRNHLLALVRIGGVIPDGAVVPAKGALQALRKSVEIPLCNSSKL